MKQFASTVLLLCLASVPAAQALDLNANSFDDVWEAIYQAGNLPPGGDSDGDGLTNVKESAAGTNPFDPLSRPLLEFGVGSPGDWPLIWDAIAGKRYWLQLRTNLVAAVWTNTVDVISPSAQIMSATGVTNSTEAFYRLSIGDVDSDADGLSDFAERALRFDPATGRTDRADIMDLQRVSSGIFATSTIAVAVLDPLLSERWPEPGVVAVRRAGGLAPLTVNLGLGGSAVPGVDYTATTTTTLIIPPGVREAWIEFVPVADTNNAEGPESIIVTLLPGTGYVVSATNSATLTLQNETESSLPSAKAAARFLIQAAFGPDQDLPSDVDDIPENVEEVMSLGFDGWLQDQFVRAPGYLQPWAEWASTNANALGLYGNYKEFSWWNRAMGVPKLRPDQAATQPGDPLRQRVAFALSEIMVVSDRPEQLAVEQVGMAHYYDLMVRHAFGNYYNLLYDVATHPAMGIYLSHLGNRKADPINHIYPDENFAREVMQLFSIGLWELNPDGTRILDLQGQPIPTYDNGDITELARVFTGLSFGNNPAFALYPRDFTVPMKMWDAEHDCDSKVLLGGLALPARVPSAGNTGTAGLADVRMAVSNLMLHANTGPFISMRLIQRLVTSNPSTSYVARVSAAFANNGFGVRGDMQAVVRALLLDPEARDPAKLSEPTWGKLREPFLRTVNLARAFNASSPSGWYQLDQMSLAHMQDPMNAPSVFNFFLPTHSPPGPLTAQGLVAPEFQIINASSAITGPNHFWQSVLGDMQYWGAGNASYAVRLNLTNELAMIVPANTIGQDVPAGPPFDSDPLLRRLDLVLTGGTLSPQQFQIIREALARINPPTWHWHRERLRLAIYLILSSPDFNVLR